MRYLRQFVIGFTLLTIMMTSLLAVAMLNQTNAQTAATPHHFYYLAADDNGILQIWQQNNDVKTQLTDAPVHVTQFDIVDRTIVYVSDATLWHDDLDDDTPANPLTTLNILEYNVFAYAFPTISADKTQVIYADGGLNVLRLDDGTSRQLLADVPLTPNGSRAAESVRAYGESTFINEDVLLLHVGIWEGRLPAIYDLATDTYIESDPFRYQAAYALKEGQVLLYSPSFRGMTPGIDIAPQDDLTSPQTLIDGSFDGLLPTENAVAMDVIEREAGQLRILATWIDPTAQMPSPPYAIIDYDMASGTATLVQQVSAEALSQAAILQFSPDGAAIVGQQITTGPQMIPNYNTFMGQLIRYDIATQTLTTLTEAPVAEVTIR